MLAKSLFSLAALFALACSGTHEAPQCGNGAAAVTSIAMGGGSAVGGMSDDALIVPKDLDVTPRPNINGAFNVVALTLRQGSSGAELYAAVRHDGDGLVCNPYFSVELRDQDDQTVGTGISGLMIRRFYRLTDGSGTVVGCVAPGDVTMVAIPTLALDTPIAAVRSVVYSSGDWVLDVAAINGISVTQVKALNRGDGVAYTGALVNGLDTPLSHPTVAIFPVNAVGRPLAVAYGGGMADIPPCGSWNFETNAVNDPGVGYDAYPMGGP
jgi:hypothetical protein